MLSLVGRWNGTSCVLPLDRNESQSTGFRAGKEVQSFASTGVRFLESVFGSLGLAAFLPGCCTRSPSFFPFPLT